MCHMLDIIILRFADNDECRQGEHGCDVNAMCKNTNGGYACACLPGFTGDGRTSCTEIPECPAGHTYNEQLLTCEGTCTTDVILLVFSA